MYVCKNVKMSSLSLQYASILLFSVCTVTAAAAAVSVLYFIVFVLLYFLLIAFLFVYKWLFSNYAFLFRYRIYCVVAVLCFCLI